MEMVGFLIIGATIVILILSGASAPATAVSIAANEVNEMNVDRNDEFGRTLDFEAWNALNALNTTLRKFIEFQQTDKNIESRDAMMHGRVGFFLFTRYCGPGSRILNKIFPTDERTYANVDVCCRLHDDCPNFVTTPDDYNQYPGLEIRPQFFSR